MYLSGLTCTDDNFTQKAGAQRAAARLGLALVAPDTSPRGLGVPGEDDSYDFGTGAGFYLNATQAPWQQYRMYEYVTEELPALLGQIPGLDLSRVRPARVAKAGILRGWVPGVGLGGQEGRGSRQRMSHQRRMLWCGLQRESSRGAKTHGADCTRRFPGPRHRWSRMSCT